MVIGSLNEIYHVMHCLLIFLQLGDGEVSPAYTQLSSLLYLDKEPRLTIDLRLLILTQSTHGQRSLSSTHYESVAKKGPLLNIQVARETCVSWLKTLIDDDVPVLVQCLHYTQQLGY